MLQSTAVLVINSLQNGTYFESCNPISVLNFTKLYIPQKTRTVLDMIKTARIFNAEDLIPLYESEWLIKLGIFFNV